MKILFVCEGLNGSSIVAQPWKHVFELAKGTSRQGHDVQVVTNRDSLASAEENIDGVFVKHVRRGRFLFDNEELLKILNDDCADIINLHGSDTWSAVHVWRLRNKLRNNVVWTLHSGPITIADLKNLSFRQFLSLYKFWNNVLNAIFPKYFVKKWAGTSQIKHTIALSARLKRHLQSLGLKESAITVIRSGVDTNKFRPVLLSEAARERKDLGLHDEDRVALFFGQLSTLRGADTVVSSISAIAKVVPSAKLLILDRGDYQNKGRWFKTALAKNKNVVLLTGILEEQMLIRYLSLADVIVLPFRFWPQVECPLTILEGMAMGKPVVATTVGAIPEIIRDGETGVLVEPGKPKLLAQAVIRLLQDSSLSERLGANAAKLVPKSYSWNIIVGQTLEVFQKVTK